MPGRCEFVVGRRWPMLLVAGVLVAPSLMAQAGSCPVVAEHQPTPAEAAYSAGHYSKAEDMFAADLAQRPKDLVAGAGLVHAELHEGEVEQAASKVDTLLAIEPNSAIFLTALAEVQLKQGAPWLALQTLDTAAKADPCYARVHLIRSRVLRLDSMHASERSEIQKAYDIDPTDPDIKHAFLSVVHPAEEIEGIQKALASDKTLDVDTRKKGQDSIDGMMSLLIETSQTCKVTPTEASAKLPLQATYVDAKHVDGYRLEVEFPKTKAKLQVDTAASGMYITRALADLNGLQQAADEPPGTVHADLVRIGGLEFRNCMLGVSEAPFAGKLDGFIGTDLFSSYLITLDHPRAELRLAPLPPLPGTLPGDRFSAPELRGFAPVYHRRQYLLVPVDLNSKVRKLFILDTGIRRSAMRPDVAHAVSSTKVNFTNSLQTVSGGTMHVYRDSFGFQYANLPLAQQGGILEMEPAAVDQSAGFQVAGMLGFDMLHQLTMHLDYRDGLVKLESAETTPSHGVEAEVETAADTGAETKSAPGSAVERAPECLAGAQGDRPTSSAMEATLPGLLDTAHLKPGKEVYVKMVNGWSDPECTLSANALLYGHVTAVSNSKNGAGSELSLAFDHADCDGHAKQPLALRVIGLVASPDQFVGLHTALPSEVSGGGRDISVTAQNMGYFALDENLNPGGPPHTIHPGFVAGLPKVKLVPTGGEACSDKITSTDGSLRLGPKTELIFSREASR